MIEGIRRRLTLGYVGIFALILALLGAVVLVSFAGRVAAQQDDLLEQKANCTRDDVQERFLKPDKRKGPEGDPPEGPAPGKEGPPGENGPRDEHERGGRRVPTQAHWPYTRPHG